MLPPESAAEEVSFEAGNLDDKKTITVDTDYVNRYLEDLAGDADLSRYIL